MRAGRDAPQRAGRRRRGMAIWFSVLLHTLLMISALAAHDDQRVAMVQNDPVPVELVEIPTRAGSGAAGLPTPPPPPEPAPEPEPVVKRSGRPRVVAPRPALIETAGAADAVETPPPDAAGDAGEVDDTDGVSGQQGDGIAEVGASRVKPRRRVRPEYPTEAIALNLEETTCRTRFTIDTRGQPIDVRVDDCPEVFHQEVRRAGYQWRFYEIRDPAGRPMKAAFNLRLTFRLR
ncbi:MAG: energy transducer TonB [Myxococcota bacterium]